VFRAGRPREALPWTRTVDPLLTIRATFNHPSVAKHGYCSSRRARRRDLVALDTGVDWRTELRVDRLVVPPAQTTEIIEAARQKLLDGRPTVAGT
jgi:hypothetical protein